MIKILRFYSFITGLVMLSAFGAYAQDCSVNAGINTTICPGDDFKLSGEFSGLISTNPNWTQLSGPSVTVSITTIAGTKATAMVTGFATDVNYVFRLTAKCTDGSLVYQDVTYVVSSLSTAAAGTDAYACPGTPFVLQGSALQAGETGKWTIIAGGSGPTISSDINPNSTVTFPTRETPRNYTFRWTVSKTTGGSTCTSFDDVIITNLGTQPVSAGGDISRSCYNVTTSAQLDGSFAGTNALYGQSAIWTFVSGPNAPTISNAAVRKPTVGNLVEGTYVFRYTVTGPCQSGSDEVSVIVAPASQSITSAGGPSTTTYCDGRTSILLTGPKALYAGETVKWTGPNGVITNPNSNITTVTSVPAVNGQTYTFTYTITNPSTNCTSVGTYKIEYKAPPTISITGNNTIFVTCDITETIVIYSQGGGTETEYALISAPAGSLRQTTMGGLNNYTTAPNSGAILQGFTEIGTYVLRYRRNTDNGTGGCSDAYADVTVVVSSKPSASNAGTNQILACNVFDTALAGNIPTVGTGKWSQVSGPSAAVIVNPLANNTVVNTLVAGKYKFRWIITGGDGECANSQGDVDVSVSSPTPTASVVGSNISVCNTTPVFLTGNTAGLNETGKWTVTKNGGLPAPEVVFNNVNEPNAIASSLANSTTYTFTWTITNACSAAFPGSVAPASYTITTSNTSGPKLANAGIDICRPAGSTSFTLAGNQPTGGETGTWTYVSGPAGYVITNPGLYNTTVTGTTNGTYVFEWKLEKNACSPTTDKVTITISPAATIANAGADQNICGDAVTLTGNTPTTGLGVWTQTEGPGGAVITDINLPGTTVTGLTDGRYKFVWTITNGACASSAPDEVTINVSSPSSVAIAGPDQAICNLTTATLAATPVTNGIGNWVAVSGPSIPVFADVTNPATAVSNLKYGVYILRWTSRGGVFCPTTQDDVEITVTQNANAGADRSLCAASSVTLAGNENSTGAWSFVSGPAGYTISNVGTNGAIVTDLVAGVYTFRYTLPALGSCPATSDDVQITIEAAPSSAVAGIDKEVCQPTAVSTSIIQMTATVPAIGTGKWVLLDSSFGIPSANNPTIADANLANTDITGMKPGVYLYEWRVENGVCIGSNANADIVRLTVFKEPSAAVAGPNQLSACSNKVTMAATAPVVGLGSWTIIAKPGALVPIFDAINSPTTKITNLENGLYTFRWTVSNGSPTCTSKTSDVDVTVTTTPVTIAQAGTDQSVCNTLFPLTTSLALAGNLPTAIEEGTWTIVSQPAGSLASFSNANANTATISGLQAATGLAVGEYVLRWTIKNIGATSSDCDSFDDVVITVYNAPSTSVAGPNQNVCSTSMVTLGATAVAVERGIGTWSNKAGNPSVAVFSDANSPAATLSGLISGTYNLIWTVSNGNCVVETSELTVVVSNCEIAIAKSTGTPVQQADGSYNITLTFKVQNTGNAALTAVAVEDNLTLTFPSPKTWTVTSLTATGTLVANAIAGAGSFTGNIGVANQQLLTNASSLAVGVEETITLVLNVKFN